MYTRIHTLWREKRKMLREEHVCERIFFTVDLQM
jgi:hypothetical protein